MKLITHKGVFHADEVFAIAILSKIYREYELIRTYDITDYHLKSKFCFVLDIGREYTPSKHNFDHHQDPKLPATNILIYDYLANDIHKIYGIDKSMAEKFDDIVKSKLLNFISDMDVGSILEEDIRNIPNISSIISGFNVFENGFDMALDLAKNVVESTFINAKKAIDTLVIWKSLENVNPYVKIQRDDTVMVDWKSLAKEDNIYLLIQPNARGGWQIVSRSTNEYIIPSDDKQSFRHNSGFMVVYPELSDAIDFVNRLNFVN